MKSNKIISKKLNDACNLLCKYVIDNLPDDYIITLNMSKDGCSMDLIDPDGHDLYFDGGIFEAVEYAKDEEDEYHGSDN